MNKIFTAVAATMALLLLSACSTAVATAGAVIGVADAVGGAVIDTATDVVD